MLKLVAITAAVFTTALVSQAHDGAPAPATPASTNQVVPMKFEVETKGPVKAPLLKVSQPVSGQGYWKFVAATNLVPVPAAACNHLKGAHGTIIIDPDKDTVYWGLQGVGWIGFSNHLADSWIIQGDPMFSHGNLHGADIIHRRGKLPLVAVADNVDGQVYLSDTSFQHAEKLDWPAAGPYKAKKEFHPTDVAFIDKKDMFVTDGYGKAYVMPVTTEPLKYEGTFMGGKEFSQTPHGVTYSASDKTLFVSARPEGQIKRWLVNKHKWLETLGLPAGSTVCDIDLWGDYALAPCLDGPDKKPGPIYIINLKKQTIVGTIRPKEDLCYTDAQHIHDAAWYVTGKGDKQEVYIVFTNWNPGGVGALKLVNATN
ncbi:hypothetical protein [Pedosphaera parvula]|uniref:NHL repeat containing protein n=1 Tax=Pedosphaera parvula (strain Ellin514) TaxID=320771 RepID=B9XKL3_PEDPL|nr:hypothetical protein [Pedosphaera parvula]EEF59683.1 hypothetical protein Cflav_PD2672 [Pedosphaera parvula Ellin514]